MNSQQIRGAAKILAGKLQQTVGNLLDDDELYVRGSRQQVAGRRLKGRGDVRQRIDNYARIRH